MLNKLKTTIAVVDSGVGGVSVLRELKSRYPNYNYIYFADNLYMPYGKRSKTFLKKRLDEIIKFLNEKYLVDEIILACNTASSVIDASRYKNVHTMLFDKTKTYLATPLTKNMLSDFSVLSDTRLASLIEEHIFDKKHLSKLIKNHIKRLNLSELESFVLGCTHYELCYELFKKCCPNSEIIKNSKYLLDNLKLDYEADENSSVLVLQSKPSNEYLEKLNKLIRG